jgi:Domain of Unknown Function with PDB structure (DUF3857)
MKRLCLFFLVWLFAASLAFSQNAKLNKLSIEELQAKHCPIDSSADAYVIGEYGDTRFEVVGNRFKLYFDYTVRIKILKKTAFDWATVNIPYYKDTHAKEELTSIKGSTYNLVDGKIVEEKMGKDAIFDEHKDKNYYNRKLTLPNVKEGSVIEYSYTIMSDYYTIRTWTFQTSIPTIWSQYKVKVPEYFRYSLNAQGYEPFAVSVQERDNLTLQFASGVENITATRYEFAVRNAPALRSEAHITTIQDFVAKITFELASYEFPGQVKEVVSNSIEAINKNLWDDNEFGLQIGKVGFLDDVIQDISTKTKDTTGRIALAIKYLQSQIKWDEKERFYTSDMPKKIFDVHAGNSADINLMLIGMLQKLKLAAFPVILSTRANGRLVTHNPQIRNFDYVVAALQMGNSYVYLDATEPFLKLGVLPMRCLNHTGLLLRKNGTPEWVEIVPTERYTTSTMIFATINNEGQLAGQVTVSKNGYEAVDERRNAHLITKEKFEENYKKEHPNWEIKKIEITNIDSLAQAFQVKSIISTSDGINVAGDRIYFKPFIESSYDKNPFQKPDRKYPVDFGALIDDNIVATITIPDGYTVDELPKNEALSLPEGAGRFLCVWQNNGKTIQISSRLSIKKTTFFAEEYVALRAFFDKIVARHATQLVLKKI